MHVFLLITILKIVLTVIKVKLLFAGTSRVFATPRIVVPERVHWAIWGTSELCFLLKELGGQLKWKFPVPSKME